MAPPKSSVSELCQAVEPPQPGGGTAWAQSPSETGRCNHPSQEVTPLGLGLRALVERCNRLSQAVAPLELGLRALEGGATAPVRRCNRLSSVFELWQGGATAPDRGGTAQRLSLRALPGGATAPVRRCNRLIPEFRELTVLSSKFELGWGL